MQSLFGLSRKRERRTIAVAHASGSDRSLVKHRRSIFMNRFTLTAAALACGVGITSAVAAQQPGAISPDAAAVVHGNNQFACDLYRQLGKDQNDGNLFFSPYSISNALAMTYAGARDK